MCFFFFFIVNGCFGFYKIVGSGLERITLPCRLVSCWRVNLRPSLRSSAAIDFLSRWLLLNYIYPLILQVHVDEKLTHIVMLPLPCWSVGMVCSMAFNLASLSLARFGCTTDRCTLFFGQCLFFWCLGRFAVVPYLLLFWLVIWTAPNELITTSIITVKCF